MRLQRRRSCARSQTTADQSGCVSSRSTKRKVSSTGSSRTSDRPTWRAVRTMNSCHRRWALRWPTTTGVPHVGLSRQSSSSSGFRDAMGPWSHGGNEVVRPRPGALLGVVVLGDEVTPQRPPQSSAVPLGEQRAAQVAGCAKWLSAVVGCQGALLVGCSQRGRSGRRSRSGRPTAGSSGRVPGDLR